MENRRLAHIPLYDRVAPYLPSTKYAESRSGFGSLREILLPIVGDISDRLARAFGVHESLSIRLERIHSDQKPMQFRLKQITLSFITFLLSSGLAISSGMPLFVTSLFGIGASLLTFLVIEQIVASKSAKWKTNLKLEIPVVAEQLAMLLGAGFSLGAALNRIAERGKGACGRDLRRVCLRIQQAISESDALEEWAQIAQVPAVLNLVSVLALNRYSSNLGRLVSEEARSIRREAQRDLVELMDRRSQQVWIPVTIATLVPGTIFLMIPFLDALRAFSQP